MHVCLTDEDTEVRDDKLVNENKDKKSRSASPAECFLSVTAGSSEEYKHRPLQDAEECATIADESLSFNSHSFSTTEIKEPSYTNSNFTVQIECVGKGISECEAGLRWALTVGMITPMFFSMKT